MVSRHKSKMEQLEKSEFLPNYEWESLSVSGTGNVSDHETFPFGSRRIPKYSNRQQEPLGQVVFRAERLAQAPNEATKRPDGRKFDANTKTFRKRQKRTKILKSDRSGSQKRTFAFLGTSKYLIFPTVVYIVTVYCSATSCQQYSPLRLVSAEHAILILHILSKVGDLALGTVVEPTWKSIKWAVTAREIPTSLSTIFALRFETGLHGLCDIAKGVKRKEARTAGLWGSVRLVVLVLFLGPGTFLMSDIKIQDIYFPVEFSQISGGMGVFNTSLIPVFQEASGPLMSGLVQSILTDPSISFEIDPIAPSCKLPNSSCASFLLPGGVVSVSPWPVNMTIASESAYIIQGGPSYQLEYEAVVSDISWASESCHVYGSNSTALQICIENATTTELDGQLLTGWRVCPTSLTDDGDCNQPGSWEASQMWNTSLAIYRRNVTVAASRMNEALLQAKDFHPPRLQLVQPSDLFQAFDAILTPIATDSDLGDFSAESSQLQLTKSLYTYLNQTMYYPNPSIGIPQEYLRNLLATPLFLCNSVMLTTADSPESIQPGLLPENYILGSYSRTPL